MAYWNIPAGSTFGLCRKYIREMFREIFNGTLWQSITTSLKFGDVTSGDYFEIEPDGTVVYRGDATVWDDIVGSLIGTRLYSVVGTLDYNFDNNSITMQPGGGIADSNDRLIFTFQYPHGAITGGTMNLHVHWEQYDALDREFTVQYRVQSNGNAKATAWTTVVVSTNSNNLFSYTSGTINQITELVEVDLTSKGLSAAVQFRLARTDSQLGDIESTFVDAHVARDMNGSRQEWVK